MRWIWGLLLAVVLAALLFFQLSGDPPPPERPVPADLPATAPGEEAPGGPAGPPEAAGRGSIYGTVRRSLDPCPARIEVRRLPGAQGAEAPFRRGPAPGEPLAVGAADETGRFEITGLRPGRLEVLGIAADGAVGRAVVDLGPAGARIAVHIGVPAGRHSVRGRVLHADGRPFVGLVALELPTSPRDLRFAWFEPTEADGRFLLTGLEAGERRLVALVPGGVRHAGPRVRVPHEDEIVFVIDEGYRTLRGRVTARKTGAPVRGATVVASGGENGGRFAWVRCESDEDGRFIAHLPDGYFRVAVSAPGYWPVELWAERRDDGVDILLDRIGSVTGVVLAAEDRSPLAGVPVHAIGVRSLWGDFDKKRAAHTVTDESGSFTLPDLSADDVMVFARGDGRVSVGLAEMRAGAFNRLMFRLGPGGEVRLELLAERAARAQGTVTDAEGRPVPGARVRAKSGDRERRFPFEPVETATDEQGRFTLDALVPGIPYRFTATPPEGPPGKAGPLSGGAGETIPVSIRLPVVRALEVSVREAGTGRPVPGAHVDAFPESGGRLRFPSRVTDLDGRLRLEPLPVVKTRLYAWKQDHVTAGEQVWVPADAGTEPIVLLLSNTQPMSGRVLLPDDRPASGAEVSCYDADPDRNRLYAGVRTAVDGRFGILGMPGPKLYRLVAALSGGGGIRRGEVHASPGEENLVIRLEETVPAKVDAPAKLRILVLDPDGRPVPSGQIQLIAFGPEGTEVYSTSGDFRLGRFEQELEGNEDKFWIAAHMMHSHAGAVLRFAPKLVGPVPAGTEEIEVRVENALRISGVVRGPNGHPVAGVLVTGRPVYPDGISVWSAGATAWTDSEGRFLLTGVGDRRHEVYAAAPPGLRYGETVTAEAGAEDVEIRLRAADTASITVLDPDGRPVPGAGVAAVLFTAEGEARYSVARGVTDQTGSVELTGLPPEGRLGLVAHPPKDRRDLFPVRDLARPVGDVEIRLLRGLWVRGRIRDRGGATVGGALAWGRTLAATWFDEIWAGFDEGGWRAAKSLPDGRFEIGPFPPGTVRVVARPADTGPYLWEDALRDVQAGAEDVDLTLVTGADIRIRIPNWPKDAHWTSVSLTPNGREEPVGGTISEGRVVFAHLPPDERFTFFVGPIGDGLMLLLRDLAPGGEEIVAKLEPGKTIEGRLLLPPGASGDWIIAKGPGWEVWTEPRADGEFLLQGLPDGPCRLTAKAETKDDRLEKTVEARAGATVTIDLAGEEKR